MKNKNKIIEANFVLPKSTKKIVWAGTYGGHYNCIVFFKSKPVLSKEHYHLSNIIDGKYYDTYENKNLIIGCMWLEQFQELYPKTNIGNPEAIEIINVFQIKLEGFFDKYGRLVSFEFNAD